MARAALAGGRADQAVVLAGRALTTLVAIQDRFGEMLSYADLAQALAGLDSNAYLAAAYRAWSLAVEIGDSSAEARGHLFTKVMKDALPAEKYREIMDQLERTAEAVVRAVIDSLEGRVQRVELDPYEPPAG